MENKILLQDLAQGVSARTSIQKKDADSFVRNVFDIIIQYLQEEKIVKIKGLGTFKVIEVSGRDSVNVNTGERIHISGHSKITFTPDAALRDQVNRPFADFETIIINDGIDIAEMERVPEVEEKYDEEDIENDNIPARMPDESDELSQLVGVANEVPITDDTDVSHSEDDVKPSVDVNDVIATDNQQNPLNDNSEEEPSSEEPVEESQDKLEEENSSENVTEISDESEDAAEADPETEDAEESDEAAEADDETPQTSEEESADENSSQDTSDSSADASAESADETEVETSEGSTVRACQDIDTTDNQEEENDMQHDTNDNTEKVVYIERRPCKYCRICFVLLTLALMALSYLAGHQHWFQKDYAEREKNMNELLQQISQNKQGGPKNAAPATVAGPHAVQSGNKASAGSQTNAPEAKDNKSNPGTASASATNPVPAAGTSAAGNSPAATANTGTSAGTSAAAATAKTGTPAGTSAATSAATSAKPGTSAATSAAGASATAKPASIASATLKEPGLNDNSYDIVGTRCNHTVKSGEGLYRIARMYYNDMNMATYIMRHNAISNPDNISEGTVLRIPELKKK